MTRDLESILKLKVPIIVRLGHRRMPIEQVLELAPGAILEMPQQADRPLELMVNNVVIGHGRAVKIGENFGLRVINVGDVQQRVAAMGSSSAVSENAGD